MILFYLSETFKSIKRAKLASFLSVNSIALAVLFSLVSLLIIFYSNGFERFVKNKVEIILFLQKDLGGRKISEIEKKLKSDPNNISVRYVSQADAAKEFKEKTGEDFSELLDDNPLPASFRVKIRQSFFSINNLDQIKKNFSSIDGVADVIFDYDFVLRMLRFIDSAKIAIYIIAILFIAVAVYFVYSTNRLQINSRMREYEIMKLVGAKLSAITVPIYISGFFLGLSASLLCLVLIYIILILLSKLYVSLNSTHVYLMLSIIVVFLGIFFGMLGSYFSSKKINWKI